MPHTQHARRRPGESTFALFILILSIFLLWQSYNIKGFESLSSPGAFPMAVSVIMVLTSCIIFIQSQRLPIAREERFFHHILPPVVAILFVIIFIFATLIQSLGFLLSALIFLFSSIKFLYRSNLIRTVYLSFLCVVSVYVVFRLLFKVILPEGIVPEREFLAFISDLFKH